MENIKYFDLIILGCGPAGLSTALYTCRANISTMIIGKVDGSMAKADIENFFGLEKKTSGKVLIDNTINNLKNLGAEFCFDYAVKIEPENNIVHIETAEGKKFDSGYLVIAIGKKIADSKFKGKNGISYCAVCDGFFYRKKTVAVLGNNVKAVEDYNYLKNICNKVYLLTGGKEFLLNGDFEVITDIIKNYTFDENNNITGIEFDDKSINIGGLFICDSVSVDSMQSYGIITKNGSVSVDENYQTNLKNIFAVGDVIGQPYQVAKAVYDGMKCADKIIKTYISEKNKIM